MPDSDADETSVVLLYSVVIFSKPALIEHGLQQPGSVPRLPAAVRSEPAYPGQAVLVVLRGRGRGRRGQGLAAQEGEGQDRVAPAGL